MARDTIVDRFFDQCENRALKPALWHKVQNTWKHITWKEYGQQARRFAGALLALGFDRGSAVTIMGYNCPEWLIADVGTMIAGGMPAGIYQTLTREQSAYIANHCESVVLVLENKALWDQLELDAHRDAFETVRKFVMMRDAEHIDHPDVVSWEDFLASGDDQGDAVDARIAEIEPDDIGTLVYTSGTTGPPKAVMLSHHNLAWTSARAIEVVGGEIGEEDCIVSYLPLSHIAEQMFSVHLPITAGVPVWIAESLPKLKDCLVVARPTLFLGVPRVWEKFKVALEARLSEATGLKKSIVSWSRSTLVELGHIVIREGEAGLSTTQRVQWRLANRLFADKIKSGVGFDRLKVAVTGAAPIGFDVLEFFLSCGIIIHEVYGQSEDNGPTTFNFPEPGKRKLGTAGKPFPGTEVKIAEDGEILVRGDNVFQGYLKDEKATGETLIDGWLHSGDVGRFDEDGFLLITDRKKDLIITAGGKNVAPQNIEKRLRSIDGIGHAVVIGDRLKFLSALLTLDPDRAPAVAAEHGWPIDLEALAAHEPFRAWVESEVERVNADLARYETIKKFALLPHDFTIETGELTPSQKIKRRVVNEKYADVIEGFYEGLD